MELKQKGDKAEIGAFKQLKVSLIWTSAVDLDLMAFYKTKDGKAGGVFSDNYAGGSLGDLNNLPYIQLSGDEGIGAAGGDNREELRVTKLDHLEELYICALNFTDASSGTNKVFSNYDARVEVVTDRGESHVVKLDSNNPGPVAVLCKFNSSFMGASINNDSEVMSFERFKTEVPGANALKLASKITLASKGDSFNLKPKEGKELVINLNWNQNPGKSEKRGILGKMFGSGGDAIDLDLGVFFEMTDGTRACVQPLNSGFLQQGAFDEPPYIYHMGDDRTGAWSEGENVKVNLNYLHALRRIHVFTYIYEGVPQWSATDGIVTIKVPGQPVVEVPMGSQQSPHPFCAIASLEIENGGLKVTKLVTFHRSHQECDHHYNWGLKWVAGSKD